MNGSPTETVETIGVEEGWKHCLGTGINPLLSRIETAFDDVEFERCTIKASTYMEVYEYVVNIIYDQGNFICIILIVSFSV